MPIFRLTSKKAESSPSEARAYSSIAPYYDELMIDVEYERWVDYTVTVLHRMGIQPGRVLDLACGTGTTTLLLSQKGLRVSGADNSPGMLEIARQKARNTGREISFLEQDMRALVLKEPVELMTCFFDSINYMLEEDDLLATFQSVFDSLRDGGLFLFDVNTEHALSTLDPVYVRKEGKVTSIWRNYYHKKDMTVTLDLTLFVKEGEVYRQFTETHQERAWSEKALRQALNKAGFRRTTFYKHLTFQPPDRETNRLMVIAEK
jgi:ubiquinone/menaquinone biosynthesis C-methylase UbiE